MSCHRLCASLSSEPQPKQMKMGDRGDRSRERNQERFFIEMHNVQPLTASLLAALSWCSSFCKRTRHLINFVSAFPPISTCLPSQQLIRSEESPAIVFKSWSGWSLTRETSGEVLKCLCRCLSSYRELRPFFSISFFVSFVSRMAL